MAMAPIKEEPSGDGDTDFDGIDGVQMPPINSPIEDVPDDQAGGEASLTDSEPDPRAKGKATGPNYQAACGKGKRSVSCADYGRQSHSSFHDLAYGRAGTAAAGATTGVAARSRREVLGRADGGDISRLTTKVATPGCFVTSKRQIPT